MSHWYFTYSKFRIEPRDIPETPHWAVMVFKDFYYVTPGYERDDFHTREKVKVVDYYAFSDKKSWEDMISQYYLEKQTTKSTLYVDDNVDFVFYRCTGRGKVSMKVEVNIEQSDTSCGYRDGYDPQEGNRG